MKTTESYLENTTLISQRKSLLGQLYDGYDEEYDCPILDEDRVSTIFFYKVYFVFKERERDHKRRERERESMSSMDPDNGA